MLVEFEGKLIATEDISYVYPDAPKQSGEGTAFEYKPDTVIQMKDGKEFRSTMPLEMVQSKFLVVLPESPNVDIDVTDVVKKLSQISGHLDNIGQQLQRLTMASEGSGLKVQITNQVDGVGPPLE